MGRNLSAEAKQTFQVVALLSTIAVVAIHYQSAAPTSSDPGSATWNELIQEFLLGGVARVAVPLFALASGFFYFLSDDGSRAAYLRKLCQRCRSVLFPYFIIASLATATWLIVRRLDEQPLSFTLTEFLCRWLVRPPAEQLWFLRDLMFLVAIAPLIRACLKRVPRFFLAGLMLLWVAELQPFPIVGGWHLLHIETLLFFSVGAAAVSRLDFFERFGHFRPAVAVGLGLVWIDLVITRVFMRPDFDAWYRADFDAASLVVYKLSILVGCVATFALCWRLRARRLIQWSGLSFFVFLTHEFPLRAAIERIAEQQLDKPLWFWFTTPIALAICVTAGSLMNQFAPAAFGMIAGGRTPESAKRISTSRTDGGAVATTGVPGA